MPVLDRPLVHSIVLAAGIAVAGALVGRGFVEGRLGDRYVTVKGVSERDARADLAIWPLRIVAADNDLDRAHTRLETSIATVRAFLARSRLDTSQIELQDFAVTDARVDEGGDAREDQLRPRYVIRQTMVVRSTDPDRVLAASQRVADLVSAGVVLSSGSESGSGGPTFVFTGLNTIKPPMIAEATARAREAAEQFARDSHSQLGGIREASQGLFEILPRDQASGITEESQVAKTVRVVATVDYELR